MKFCSVTFNIDGSMNNQTYSYKTELDGLKEGDVVLVETYEGLKRARFVAYEDTVNFPEDKLRVLVEKWVD